MRRPGRLPLWLALALITPACSGLLVKSTPAPAYYRLDYAAEPVSCETEAPGPVRVWSFAASAPFDDPAMAVIEGDRQVAFSASSLWVAPPGSLLAERLIRDLGAGDPFSRAVGGDSPMEAPFELSGRIYDFSWDRRQAGARARLQVELSVVDRRGDQERVALEKEYELESDPAATDDAATFAAAMSGLVQELSTRLRRDLCAHGLSAPEASGLSGTTGPPPAETLSPPRARP